MRYLILLEDTETGCGAYVADLPGCVTTAGSREEALRFIKEAIKFHIEGLRETGKPVPAPPPVGELVEVDAA